MYGIGSLGTSTNKTADGSSTEEGELVVTSMWGVCLADDNILLVFKFVISLFGIIQDLWRKAVRKANQEGPHAAGDVDAFVIELSGVDQDLALLEFDSLTKASEVRSTALIFIDVSEHCLPCVAT